MFTRPHFPLVAAALLAQVSVICIILAPFDVWIGLLAAAPVRRTAAQLPPCSPLVWLIDNLLVVEMPPSGGWTANQAPIDPAVLAVELPVIYSERPLGRRLLLIQADSSRREEDITWLLAPLDTLAVTIVARLPRVAPYSAGGLHSPRVAHALDAWKAGSISAELAAATIADERLAGCTWIEEDTVQAMRSYVEAELARRAGGN